MVILVSGILMVVMGMMGKVAAIFTTIPEPVMGGMFIVMFGVISAAGVSNLQVHTRCFIITESLCATNTNQYRSFAFVFASM